MVTDIGTELSVPTDMTRPFLCLQRIKYWLLTTFQIRFQHSFNHLYHECPNASAHTCWIWLVPAFSLSIAVQILIAEPLDKWLLKSYNTTTLMGGFGDKTTTSIDHKFFIKNDPLPWCLTTSNWERIFTTTYTTIDTIGAPGDKMPRERERSFLP